MKDFRYLPDVTTLLHNEELCTGCKTCEQVCPHNVFEITNKKAQLIDRDACMECGACVINCKDGALSVTPGVGCAAYIIKSWIKSGDKTGKTAAQTA